jgi:hypothetical protein
MSKTGTDEDAKGVPFVEWTPKLIALRKLFDPAGGMDEQIRDCQRASDRLGAWRMEWKRAEYEAWYRRAAEAACILDDKMELQYCQKARVLEKNYQEMEAGRRCNIADRDGNDTLTGRF